MGDFVGNVFGVGEDEIFVFGGFVFYDFFEFFDYFVVFFVFGNDFDNLGDVVVGR